MSNSVKLERLKWCTAFLALAVALIGVWKLFGDVGEIHVMVNSRSERMEARIEQLNQALVDAGIAIPDAPERETE